MITFGQKWAMCSRSRYDLLFLNHPQREFDCNEYLLGKGKRTRATPNCLVVSDCRMLRCSLFVHYLERPSPSVRPSASVPAALWNGFQGRKEERNWMAWKREGSVAQVPSSKLTLKNSAWQMVVILILGHVWGTCQKWYWPNSSGYHICHWVKIRVFQ